jgi:hypothetical protein
MEPMRFRSLCLSLSPFTLSSHIHAHSLSPNIHAHSHSLFSITCALTLSLFFITRAPTISSNTRIHCRESMFFLSLSLESFAAFVSISIVWRRSAQQPSRQTHQPKKPLQRSLVYLRVSCLSTNVSTMNRWVIFVTVYVQVD